MDNDRPRLGIDLGGSKILAVVFDGDGRVVAKCKKKTKPEKGYRGVLERVVKAVAGATGEAGIAVADCAAVGIGVPGPVAADDRRVLGATNLGWGEKDIGGDLHALLGGPAVVTGNDVNCGALGEVAYGCARGVDSAFALFVGTGLGGALVIDGQIVGGAHGMAGEIGHARAPFGDARCGCGQIGCLETVASKTGMARMIAERVDAGASCLLEDPVKLRASDLRRAYDMGCGTTRTVFAACAEGLAWAVATVAAVADPSCYVFGGGVAEDLGDELMAEVRTQLDAYPFFTRAFACDLRLASLGDYAVAAGAVRLAENRL